MKYLEIKNESGLKIPFNKWIKEIKRDIDRIPKDRYPIHVIVSISEYDEEQDHFEHSKFVPDENTMHIKIIPKTTLRQIKWSFMHEFRHFMQKNIPELEMATHNQEDSIELKKLIDRIKPLNDDDFYEAFHDILPMESDAIIYATDHSGMNYKKHPLKDTIPQYIDNNKKENNSEEEETRN